MKNIFKILLFIIIYTFKIYNSKTSGELLNDLKLSLEISK